MNDELVAIKLYAEVAALLDKVNPPNKQEYDSLLRDPMVGSDAVALGRIKAQLEAGNIDSADGAAEFQRFFEYRHEAQEYLNSTLLPAVSKHFRLFKTQKMRQDEYLVVNPDWLIGEDQYQSYAVDRDVLDRLIAAGIPTTITYNGLDESNKPKRVSVSVLKAWRQSPITQAERINALCYLPGQNSIVGHAFNTFKDVSVKPIEGIDVSEMLDHIHDNICNGNTEYYHYVVRWLAHLVQHPAKRPMTGIAIIGDQATGKGVFIDFLKRLMGGPRNANTTASSDDTKGFNYALGNKLLVVFDEATFAGDRKQSDFMKKLVTEPRIRIEQKGLDAYEVDNFARVMITSNNRNSAVPANIGARRWLIMDCRGNLEQTELRAFANRIGNNPGHPDEDMSYVNGFKQYLLSVDLTSFNPQQLPMQDTGLETKLQNHYKEDPTFAFLCEWLAAKQLTLFRMKVERGPSGEEEYDVAMQWDEEVLFSDFYAVFKESCSGAYARAPGQNMMRKLLDPYGITVQSGTANVRYVHLPPPNKVLALLRRSSRFDLLVDAEQVAIIDAHKMYKDNAHRRSMQAANEAVTIEVPIRASDEATIEWLHQRSSAPPHDWEITRAKALEPGQTAVKASFEVDGEIPWLHEQADTKTNNESSEPPF